MVSDSRDYENGVADVLAFLAGDSATVDRNVRLPGRRSQRSRQIDVKVRGRIFGAANTTMIVDCKRRTRPIDVKALESFIGMVEDVGAEIGMIVSSVGSTPAAQRRAAAERGIRLEVLPLSELVQWSPPGTISITYAVPTAGVGEAEGAFRGAGFRVTAASGYEACDGETMICALRHPGGSNPPGEVQADLLAVANAALAQIGIHARHVAHGVTMSGGTPAHRWVEVLAAGVPTGLKVLADSEAEAATQLDHVAQTLEQAGIGRDQLTIRKPEGWPIQQMFGG